MKSIYDNPYSEGHPKKKDWAKILDELTFENADVWKLIKLAEAAGEWSVCACGNLCHKIKRDEYGEPNDKYLSDLGFLFNTTISLLSSSFDYADKDGFEFRLSEARITHQKIEKRAAELLGIN